VKNAYRKFNIKDTDIAAGDDYAMMREVLRRRFARALKEDPDRSGGAWPDLVVVDGGPGQLSAANEVFADLGISDLALVCIAKGSDRDAGRERFHMNGRAPFRLPPNDPVLYFMQRLRDEAHRFAIDYHRKLRGKGSLSSPLEGIHGIGKKRRLMLLKEFGSIENIKNATLEDLQKLPGITQPIAEKITKAVTV